MRKLSRQPSRYRRLTGARLGLSATTLLEHAGRNIRPDPAKLLACASDGANSAPRCWVSDSWFKSLVVQRVICYDR